jgi:hypothetical protein
MTHPPKLARGDYGRRRRLGRRARRAGARGEPDGRRGQAQVAGGRAARPAVGGVRRPGRGAYVVVGRDRRIALVNVPPGR